MRRKGIEIITIVINAISMSLAIPRGLTMAVLLLRPIPIKDPSVENVIGAGKPNKLNTAVVTNIAVYRVFENPVSINVMFLANATDKRCAQKYTPHAIVRPRRAVIDTVLNITSLYVSDIATRIILIIKAVSFIPWARAAVKRGKMIENMFFFCVMSAKGMVRGRETSIAVVISRLNIGHSITRKIKIIDNIVKVSMLSLDL